jgi:transcriptional regulator with XRE-family HTH domain
MRRYARTITRPPRRRVAICGDLRHSAYVREQEWDREHLGQTVRYARTAKGFRSRKAFAVAAGISTRSIDAVESGDRVGPKVLAAVEQILGWEPRTTERIALHQITPDGAAKEEAPAEPGSLEWLRALRRTLPENKFFEVVDQMTKLKAEEVELGPRSTSKHAVSNGPDEQS